MNQPNMITDLPEDLLPLIARIIVLWADIDYRLHKTIYNASTLTSMKYGRVLIPSIPSDQILKTLKQILRVRNQEIALSDDELKEFGKLLKKAATERGQIAHGVWTENPSGKYPMLRMTTGEDEPESENRPRKIDPAGREITPDVLRAQIKDLQTIREKIPWLRNAALNAPRPWRKRSGAKERPQDSRDRRPSKP